MMSLGNANRLGLLFAIALTVGHIPAALAGPEAAECKVPLEVRMAVAPGFPAVAHRARMFGLVNVSITVDDGGIVTGAEVSSGSTEQALFHAPAVAAAKRWQFKPAYGCAIRSSVLRFDFKQPVPPGWGAGSIFRPPFSVEVVVEEIHMPTVSTAPQ